MPAIYMLALGLSKYMTNEQFKRELRYRVSMAVVNCMLREGLISQAEHETFDALMIEKHQPPFGNILLKTSVDKSPSES